MKETAKSFLVTMLAVVCAGVGVMDVIWGGMLMQDMYLENHPRTFRLKVKDEENTEETNE